MMIARSCFSRSVGREQRHHLVLDRLHAAADLVAKARLDDAADFLLVGLHAERLHLVLDALADLAARNVDERSQMREADALAAVLVGGNLGDDLRGDVAGRGKAMGLLDHRAGDHGAVLQHGLEVHEVAVVHVLGKVVRIMEVDEALVVRLDDVLGQQQAAREVLAHFACHVVALRAVDDRILVGVLLLGLFVVELDERENLVVGRVLRAHEVAREAVADVALGRFGGSLMDDVRLDEFLDLLDGQSAADFAAVVLDHVGDVLDLAIRELGTALARAVGGSDRVGDLDSVKGLFRAVALDDLHWSVPCRGISGGENRLSPPPESGVRKIVCVADYIHDLVVFYEHWHKKLRHP